MQRIYHINDSILIENQQLHQQTAFHEAGHAAAIYFGNQTKSLPPVYFEIRVKKPEHNYGQFSAQVIGGHLIHSLELATIVECSNQINNPGYQAAYEADVMNLLVGPLAEAKFVAERDSEVFNRNLITPKALLHYGGSGDLEKAETYLSHFIKAKPELDAKIHELLHQAHDFIQRPQHWQAIKKLATYILEHEEFTISCEEIISVFDNDTAPISRIDHYSNLATRAGLQ